MKCRCTIHDDRGEPCSNEARICLPCERDCWGSVGLDVDRLRTAIYTISQRHDWEHMTDREDRTEEIAVEYAALAYAEPYR